MNEPRVGNVAIVAVGKPEAGNVGCVNAPVGHVELRADGLALQDGETLRGASVDYVLEVRIGLHAARVRTRLVDLLLVEPPMRVAKVEERRAVGMHEVLLARDGAHEAVAVECERTLVRGGADYAAAPRERRVVGTCRRPAPLAGGDRRKAHAEHVAAIPEARAPQHGAIGSV